MRSGSYDLDLDEPLFKRVREICLAYPEAVEIEAWGRPTFRAGKRVFVMVASSLKRPNTIVFKPDPVDEPALRQHPRIFETPYFGGAERWLAIDFDQPDTDWTELAELIDASYRQVALVRQLRALEQQR